ncbi:integrase core domain-containing protein [Hirsutella rhossiliensis]
MKVFEVADLQQLWDETVAKDSIFRAAYKAVRDRERAFPPSLGLKIQISEYLPPTGPSKARYLWVIVDRLTKAVTLEVMDNMEAEQCANRFLQCHYRFHGMPRSIVSDRGSNWLSRFWKRFCRLAGVTQKLSTAYHPQTDGGPERMNQEIEAYLRAYVSDQDQPFFAEHGYHVDPISVEESEEPPRHREESRADSLLSRLQEVNEYMQAVMASSQQQQEEAANAKRQPAERFEVGDKVWLSMANYRSPRPCKKLDWLHHKYTVTKVISSHVVELDVRGSIYPRFHVDLCGGRIKIRLLAKGR